MNSSKFSKILNGNNSKISLFRVNLTQKYFYSDIRQCLFAILNSILVIEGFELANSVYHNYFVFCSTNSSQNFKNFKIE